MLADDLTGACDAGVQFAQRGFVTKVWLDPEPREPADLTVITTNSRNDPPDVARRKVAVACAALPPLVFKKIDSTLYGNVAAEIEAALEACGIPEAWLAPAYPAQGRRVRDGWLEVAGSDRRVHLPAVLQGHPAIRWFDAASQEELARVARLAYSAEPRPLLVGSAGLAAEVAKLLAPTPHTQAPPQRSGSGEVIFVIGSTNPATLAQVEYLKARHPQAVVTDVPSVAVPSAARALVLAGGDTALAVCRALRVTGIRLEREVLPGIPRGTLIGGPYDGLAVVTKAGGFGAEDALAAILDSV
jgi:uncharacterized protein YgbK (DUF1537 family)